MHGYERCRKDFGVDDYELHVRLYAVKRQNKRGVFESRKQAVTAPANEITTCIARSTKHEARSSFDTWGFISGV